MPRLALSLCLCHVLHVGAHVKVDMTTAVQDVFLQGKDGASGLVLGVDHLVGREQDRAGGHLLEGEEDVDGEEHQEKVKRLEPAQNPGQHSNSHLC